jgi:chromosome partitioning protein
MKIIAIASQKGGCGKTTTAINLASALAFNQKRVLVIDLDPQAHASLGLNIQAQYSVYNALSKLTPRKLNLDDIIVNIEKGFDIAPSNILLGTIEQELADEISREARLKEELNKMKRSYDFIIIDCPPNLGLLTINAIRAASEVFIPVETSRFALIGVERLIEIIDLVRNRLNHPTDYKILLTMFDSRLRHSFNMLKTIRNLYSGKLFDTIIHINVKLKEAIICGKPVIAFDKYCRGSKDYINLAREIIHKDSSRVQETLQQIVRSFPKKELVEQKFTLIAPHAENVYVTGDFNNWNTDGEDAKLSQTNGRWEKRILLKRGIYRYKFIVDGLWQQDPNNPRSEKNAFGSFDSILEVK